LVRNNSVWVEFAKEYDRKNYQNSRFFKEIQESEISDPENVGKSRFSGISRTGRQVDTVSSCCNPTLRDWSIGGTKRSCDICVYFEHVKNIFLHFTRF